MAFLDPLRSVYHRLTRRPVASYAEVERAERIFYLTYLREGMVVFDVGANLGELTLQFARFAGARGHVHAFEPNPAVFQVLQTVCNASARTNITLNNMAISDQEGSLTLHVYSGRHAGLTSATVRQIASPDSEIYPSSTIHVPVTTLTAYCRREHVHQIDLLKIDVEGLEYKVLLGARELFEQRRVRCCVFEYGSTTNDAGATADEIERFFRSASYRVENICSGAAPFPGRERPQSAPFSMQVARPS